MAPTRKVLARVLTEREDAAVVVMSRIVHAGKGLGHNIYNLRRCDNS
jgi:hypothetical protein